MSEFYSDNNNNIITVQICHKLFWGFRVNIDRNKNLNSLNDIQWVFDHVKTSLIHFLENANLLSLLEDARKLNFHIHDPILNDGVIFLCTDCNNSFSNNK